MRSKVLFLYPKVKNSNLNKVFSTTYNTTFTFYDLFILSLGKGEAIPSFLFPQKYKVYFLTLLRISAE